MLLPCGPWRLIYIFRCLMSFLAPFGLLALLTLPVIILLHLIRERRKRVVVPSLLLWQMLPKRQEAQRQRRLPLTLLLLLHLLAALLLALALGQPQWLVSLFGSERHLAVIIDTSTSMAAPAAGVAAGSRLDAVRVRARSLISGMGGRDSLTLIDAGTQARVIDSAGSGGATRLLAALDDLKAGGTGSDMGGALVLAEAALQGLPDARIVVLSDGALPTLEGELAERQAAVPIDWQFVGAAHDNRALVTLAARPRAANAPVQVYGRAVNYGATPLRTVVRLFGDGALIDSRPVSFSPNGEVELTWTIPSGVKLLRAELDGNDDLPADDSAAISVNQVRTIRTLLVSANPARLEHALRVIPGIELTVVTPGRYRDPGAFSVDLTVLDGFLPTAWPSGGVLVLNPPPGANQLLAVEEHAGGASPDNAELSFGSARSVFDGVSLSSVDFGPLRTVATPEWAEVQLARGEQTLILRGSSGQSKIAVWTFDLAQSNLPTRLAFPLLLVRTVRDLTPAPLPAALLVGETLTLQPDPRADEIVLRDPLGAERRVSVQTGEPVRIALDASGTYSISERSGGRDLFSGTLPVNAGAAIEANLEPQAPPPTTSVPAAAPASWSDEDRQPIWPWFALAALIVMAAEWIYVHRPRPAH